MLNPFDLQMPATENVADRVEWAGERIADVAEGLLGGEHGWLVWNIIVGWADLCFEDDRRQYHALAGQLSTLLRNQEAA